MSKKESIRQEAVRDVIKQCLKKGESAPGGIARTLNDLGIGDKHGHRWCRQSAQREMNKE